MRLTGGWADHPRRRADTGGNPMNDITQRLTLTAAMLAGVATWLASVPPAAAWDRGKVETFAVLPQGSALPEGIAIGSDGSVYVSTFAGPAPGQVHVFNAQGKFLRTLNVTGSSGSLLGLDFHPTTHTLLVIDFGFANVKSVDPQTGAASVCITVPAPAPPAQDAAGLNALTFDAAGNTYISDSFLGRIWKKSGPGCGAATPWVTDDRLRTTGVPPFGANGIGFNRDGSAL